MRLVQNTLGVFLGLLIVFAGVGALSFLALQGLSRTPAKPAFPEVKKDDGTKLDIRSAADGTFPAVVVYQGELSLREGPAASSKVIDKLKFEDTVVVTGKSDDGQWQQVRVETKGIQGWISNGNLKRAQ